MRLTRRMGPDYRACARGRLLRLFVWSSCLVAVLTFRPLAAAQDARPGFGEDHPRITTSAPIFFHAVETVQFTPSRPCTPPRLAPDAPTPPGSRMAGHLGRQPRWGCTRLQEKSPPPGLAARRFRASRLAGVRSIWALRPLVWRTLHSGMCPPTRRQGHNGGNSGGHLSALI